MEFQVVGGGGKWHPGEVSQFWSFKCGVKGIRISALSAHQVYRFQLVPGWLIAIKEAEGKDVTDPWQGKRTFIVEDL